MRETEQCWYVDLTILFVGRKEGCSVYLGKLRLGITTELGLSTGFGRSVTAIVDCVILQSSGIQ